ncbi:DUF563 domain-containing protein [Nocardioides sp. DS6]|uniref:DUF563 domain-containing protein n=1 Tax=Nocardioides eburneus TaxID=3231482 RepID=A0ABV3STL4_9ACTN
MKRDAIVSNVRGVARRLRAAATARTGIGPSATLPPGTGRTVIVVGARSAGGLPDRWRARLASDTVTVVDEVATLPDVVRRLPALDAVVCLDGAADAASDVIQATYRAVRGGGRIVIDLAGVADGPTRAAEVADELHRLADHGTVRQRDLAASVSLTEATDTHVVVTKRGRHLLAPREAAVVDVLPVREPDVRVSVVEEHPGGELVSSSVVFSHGEHETDFPTHYDYPPLTLRHYEGPVVARGRTLMYAGHTVLPDSFRFHLAQWQKHPFLDPAGDGWHRLRRGRPARNLEGSYYQLESTFAHHYGHVMAEVVSRLWGWDAAKRADPDVKVFFHRALENPPARPLERRVFEAYGIAPDDIVELDEPVRVDSVFSATPMWHQHPPFYVHPGMLDTYERLAHGFTGGDPDGGPAHERIFVSRGEGAVNRTCLNQAEVEAWFAERGFEVVYPEHHTLAEQVHLFRKAREVAGFGGSGMFNIVYARGLEKLVVLNQEAYIARNEHMFCSLIGAEEHYLWSAPEVARPDGRFSLESFQGDWRFDFERNEADLRKALGVSR